MVSKPSNQASIVASASQGLPIVVLAGRANAGKSTLFNRLTRHGRAIVSAIPGTTRDLNMAVAEYETHRFLLVDSGGLEIGEKQRLTERVVEEALRAVAACDAVVFVVDGRAGMNPADRDALALIREVGRPMLVAANKMDIARLDLEAAEFHALGVEQVIPVSAAHGRGIEELLEAVVSLLPVKSAEGPHPPDLRVALIGRPNVGKSSLLNRLAGAQRSIVDEMPGTTRDPIDMRLHIDGRDLILVDTAGIRRRTKVEGELEHHSVRRAIETIRRAEVLLLVVSAEEGITDQDARLAQLVLSEERALVVIANKWDVAAQAGRRQAAFLRDARQRFPFLEFAPLLFSSALTGDGVRDILPAALRVGANFRATFQTSQLNRILAQALAAMDPPVVAGKRLNLLYVTQIASAPPRLVLFSNLERDIPVHYARFLENRFRSELNLEGTPLKLIFRRRAPGSRAGRAAG